MLEAAVPSRRGFSHLEPVAPIPMLTRIAFALLSLLVLGSGVLVITRRQPLRALRWLVVALLGTAGIYLTAGAWWLFGVQAILYAGISVAVMVPGIVALHVDVAAAPRLFNPRLKLALGASLGLALGLGYAILRGARLGPPGWATGALRSRASGAFPAPGVPSHAEYALWVEVGALLAVAVVVGVASLVGRQPE